MQSNSYYSYIKYRHHDLPDLPDLPNFIDLSGKICANYLALSFSGSS